MIEIVYQKILTEVNIFIRLLFDEFKVGKNTICDILIIYVNKRKVCARFVLHDLTNKQQLARVNHCQEIGN